MKTLRILNIEENAIKLTRIVSRQVAVVNYIIKSDPDYRSRIVIE